MPYQQSFSKKHYLTGTTPFHLSTAMPIVDLKTATAVFSKFDKALKSSYLHPSYVVADAARNSELRPLFYIYEDGDSCLYHAFHTQEISGTRFIDIQSPYGYGGPISTSDSSLFLYKAWNEYDKWCQSSNVLVEFIRFHPLLKNWRYYRGDVLDNRETVSLDLTCEDIMSQYAPRMRTSIRQGYRQGLEVQWVNPMEKISDFQSIYTSGMVALRASSFYFFPKRYFQELASSQLIWLGLCYQNLSPVAGAVFLISDTICEYHLGASTSRGKDCGAMKVLFHEAALKAQNSFIKQLYLGGGSDTSPNNTLLLYKKKFGRNEATFKIGRRIHQETEYNRFKIQKKSMYQDSDNKILFYR